MLPQDHHQNSEIISMQKLTKNFPLSFLIALIMFSNFASGASIGSCWYSRSGQPGAKFYAWIPNGDSVSISCESGSISGNETSEAAYCQHAKGGPGETFECVRVFDQFNEGKAVANDGRAYFSSQLIGTNKSSCQSSLIPEDPCVAYGGLYYDIVLYAALSSRSS